MPINRLLSGGSKFTAEEIERLNKAYTYALRSLSLVDRNDPITEMIARKVLDVGASGISDPVAISEMALKHFKT